MKKRKILTKIVFLMLLMTALLLVACRPNTPGDKLVNKHNVATSHTYVLSVKDKRLYRCDYNEYGRPWA